MIECFIKLLSGRSRAKRAKLFLDLLKPTEKDLIIDLGSADGSYFSTIVPFRNNVFIADIDKSKLDLGKERYGFNTAILSEDGSLPFPDKYFDILFCSSVIEHVTLDKSQIEDIKSGEDFRKYSFARQTKFANEIDRVAKRYFVQTPNKYFLMESHTWVPFAGLLPRSLLIKLIGMLNKFWIKKTSPDWNLLTYRQMKKLFGGSKLYRERFLFLFTKSIICIKN